MYRLYTEDTGLDGQLAAMSLLTEHGIDGATLTRGFGVWRGKMEPALVIEIVSAASHNVYDYAEHLRRILKQEAILVVNITEKHRMVTA